MSGGDVERLRALPFVVSLLGMRRGWTALGTLALLVAALFAVAAPAAGAATVLTPTATFNTDGPIISLAASARRIFAYGSFQRFGFEVSTGVRLDPTSGATLPGYISPNISRAIADNDGGWYATADADYGAAGTTLIHLRADGELDPAFAVPLKGPAHSLVLSHDGSTLYAGMGTTVVAVATRQPAVRWLVRLDPGSVNPGNANALIMSPDDQHLYVGGTFRHVEDQARTGLARLNAATGAIEDWAPDVMPHPYGYDVRAFALTGDGRTLYAGGLFDHVSGQAHHDLAAIDVASATATSWDPGPTIGSVHSLVLSPDERLIYATGDGFGPGIAGIDTATGMTVTRLGVNEVRTLAASPDRRTMYGTGYLPGGSLLQPVRINTVTGAVAAWPVANALDLPSSFAVSTTGIVYSAGDRFAIGGFPVHGFDVFAPDPGSPPTDLPRTSLYQTSMAASADGRTLYVVGADSADPKHFGDAIDVASGQFLRWHPQLDSEPYGLTVAGRRVFTTTGGSRLRALDATSGRLIWSTPSRCQRRSCDVSAFAVSHDGRILYAAMFDAGSYPAPNHNFRLAAYDARTGKPRKFDVRLDGAASSLVLSPHDTTLYIAGGFSHVNRRSRFGLAAIDAHTSAIKSWRPIPHLGTPSNLLELGSGPLLFNYAPPPSDDCTLCQPPPRYGPVYAVDIHSGRINQAWTASSDALTTAGSELVAVQNAPYDLVDKIVVLHASRVPATRAQTFRASRRAER